MMQLLWLVRVECTIVVASSSSGFIDDDVFVIFQAAAASLALRQSVVVTCPISTHD